MKSRCGVLVLASLAALVLAPPAISKPKVPELAKAKFDDIAKYLSLTREQQEKIKPDVVRIQDIVKQAGKQRGPLGGWGGGGPRSPVGGGWGGTGGGAPGARGDGAGRGGSDQSEQMRAQREEWQKEITNRVEEIKGLLTPEQLEKFNAIAVPNVVAPPSRLHSMPLIPQGLPKPTDGS